jgi:transposase, IS5 family
MSQLGLFDLERRYESLSQCRDPLETLLKAVDFEMFRPLLRKLREKDRKSSAGRKPYDVVLMFKVLVLQRLFNLSDHQIEFQIKDRLSFMRFLGLQVEGTVPDEKTVWLFREELTRQGLVKELFSLFERFLAKAGYKAKEGSIVDATIVEVPRQRNSREENQAIKQGEIPQTLKGNEPLLRQKDLDARWAKKHGKSYYGYKNHVRVDAEHKLIRQWTATAANVHDSQTLDALMEGVKRGGEIYGDSAYSDGGKEMGYERRGQYCLFSMKDRKEWKEWNRSIARVRARVEHVFGFMENSMREKFLRYIGLARNQAAIGMMNLVYNLCRYRHLEALR